MRPKLYSDGLTPQQRYVKRHPEKRKLSYLNYMEKNREIISIKRNMPENMLKKRNGQILSIYGIKMEVFEQMISLQNNKCAICNRAFTSRKHTHIDHNHATGKIRQILCNKCNIGIGQFNDDINIMKLAINYLERWE